MMTMTTNNRFMAVVVALVAAALACTTIETTAFVTVNPASSSSTARRSTSLSAAVPSGPEQQQHSSASCSRRDALFGVAAAAFLGVSTSTVVAPTLPAQAKYSDYSRREKDWEERQKTGEVKYSTARDLRKQLAEIVPANSEGSKVFCPNGPSAAVSPLMENKCSDIRMAMPSVYGRQSDAVGNSIPGFSSGYAWGPGDGSASISASIGGMPAYKENEWKLRNQ